MNPLVLFVSQHWRAFLVAGLIATNAASCGLWRHAGKQVTQLKEAAAQQAKAAEKLDKEQKAIAKETSDAWAAAVDYTRGHPQRVLQRLCATDDAGSGPSAAGPGTGSVHGAAGASEIPQSAAQIEADFATAVITANALQNYIEKLEASLK